jgi:hypothetical protein
VEGDYMFSSPITNPAPTKDAVQKVLSADNSLDPEQNLDPLIFAWMQIYKTVQINHESAITQAKLIAINAQEQEAMIHDEAQIKFQTFRRSQLFNEQQNVINADGDSPPNGILFTPKAVGQQTLNELQSNNQEITAVRGVLENQIGVLRQTGQLGETNLNSAINQGQQSIAQGAGILQMFQALTDKISRI